eukprot:RCo051082
MAWIKRDFSMYQKEIRRSTKAVRQPGQSYADLAPVKSKPSKLPVPEGQLAPPAPSPGANGESAGGLPPKLSAQELSSLSPTRPAPSAHPSLDLSELYYPEGRSRASAVAYEGGLYFFGGCATVNTFTGNHLRNDIFYYQISSRQWYHLECMGYFPRPRMHHSLALKDHKLVVFGGIGEDGLVLNDMFAVSLREAHLWKKVAIQMKSPTCPGSASADQPPGLCGHSAVIHPIRNSMMIYGGRSSEGFSSHVYEFCFSTQQWSCLDSMQKPFTLDGDSQGTTSSGPLLYGHTAALYQNTMFVCGGWTYHAGYHQFPNDGIFSFNFDTAQWTAVVPSCCPRPSPSASPAPVVLFSAFHRQSNAVLRGLLTGAAAG